MASADILRAAHTPLPWVLMSSDPVCFASVKDGQQEYYIGHCYINAEPDVSGRSNAAFIVRACNAHYQMLEALKALVALPVAEKQLGYLRGGIGTATPDRAWLDAVAAIAAAEAEAGR